ncbi:MAG TPA: YihY/virulence factor BrkB family protein [Gammaproteobacteria bacterium]|nr:YihY/virulence factor BrkB family protein [Gammaproteobacteria bacterium]
MEFITRPIERRLWPRGKRTEPVPRAIIVAQFVYALVRDFMHGDLSMRAMSLVYTTMIAIVPLLAFVFSFFKGLGLHRDLEPILQGFLAPLGPRASELSSQVIGFVDNVSGFALGAISIAILLYSALSMAQKVESSFNYVWRVDRPRSFARRFAEYLSVMLVGPLIMLAAMGFTATLSSTAAMTRLREIGVIGDMFEALSWFTPYALIIASFSSLYVFVPNTRVQLLPAAIGGVFAGILWAGGGSTFASFVVSVSRYEPIYAGFAIVIVAMIWLYLSWLILLLGAQLAFYVQHPEYLPLGQRTLTASNRTRERLALSTMLLVGRDFEKPGHGWRIESAAAQLRVPRHLLEPVAGALMDAGLLTRTNENRLIPARDLRRIGVVAILAAVRSERDSHHQGDDDWTPTVAAVADDVEAAIRSTLGERTLADLVDADSRSTATPS